MAKTRKNLGDILIEEGVLSREELDDVLEKSKARRLSLHDTLFKLGYISRDRLGSLLAEIHDCEFVDLYSCKIDSDAISAIPPEQALELQALPYAVEDETLSVALSGESIEVRPLEEVVRLLERLSGKTVRVSLCNPGPLKEMLMRFCQPEPAGASPIGSSQGELATIIGSLKSGQAETSLRGHFEELYDIGQTALIGARSHPFIRAVASAIEQAKAKLGESRKYVESGFEEEAVEMAKQAVTLIKEATARADSFEKDWEKHLHEVKRLRGKIATLESEGAAEYAPVEFKELTDIREALLECVNERNVDKLRSLLDQGMVVTEKVSLLEPGRSRGREQVIASLAQVREVIARARNAGAKEHAPDTLKEAYDFLDRAEAYARRAQWEDVRECLSAAEAQALEAESAALRAVKEREQLTIKLRESIRTAISLFEEALTHSFAHEVIENLMRAKDVINETKACFDSDELERGIGLALNVARRIRDEIIPLADEAERLWNELFARADSVSAQIQTLDIPLALKISPEKMKLLFQSERDVVASLCERDREKLTEAVSVCEGLAEEVRQHIAAAQERLRQAGGVLDEVSSLLASSATSGIDEKVAATYDEARRMLEEARVLFEQGDTDAAVIRAQAARAKLESEVIEPQDSARQEWNAFSQRASEASRQIHLMNIPLALSVVPEKMERLFESERQMVAALSEGDRDRLAEAVSVCEELAEEIRQRLASAQDNLLQVENVIKEVDALLASTAAYGIDEEVAPAYDASRRMLEEARSFFEVGDADGALSRAQAARVKLETEVVEPRDSAQREWNELSQKAIEVSEQVQSMNMPLVLRIAPEKMDLLFQKERDMIGSLSARNRDRLAEAVSVCEGLADEIRRQVAAARDGMRLAETAIEDATKFLATAAASGIDEKVASAYDESRQLLEEAKSLLERGEAEGALGCAETARQKLETEVIQSQDSVRHAWRELSLTANEAFEKIQSIDVSLAFKVIPEKMELLLAVERRMAEALCERDRDKLVQAVSVATELAEEVAQSTAAVREDLQRAENAMESAADLLASAVASGIEETVAPIYEEARRMLDEARSLFERGEGGPALARANAARVKLETEVVVRQKAAREKWLELSPRSDELLEKIEQACSADAMRYCPDLVRALRAGAAEIVSAVISRDIEKLEAALGEVEKGIESLSGSIEAAKAERYKDLSDQLVEVEEAVQTAVERCAGNYAPDMLEAAYLDINRIKDSLSGGPQALTSELESQLARDLAVAKTKVWQVEFMRERVERERQENLNQLRLKLDAAREAVEACSRLDFVGESSPLIREARSLLERVDSLILEGDIEEGFECIRGSDSLADRIRADAEKNEAEWKELAERLCSEAAPHRSVLAEPAAKKVAGEEAEKLAALDEQTQSLIDSRDLDALKRHADELAELAESISERVAAWKSDASARIEERIRQAGREVRVAELLGAKTACPDVLNAAATYADIAKTYLEKSDFDNAGPAADDALAKASEASRLAKESSRRESSLALEYMKIASAHIEQQNPEAAKEALKRGLNLAQSSGAAQEEPSPEAAAADEESPAGTPPEPETPQPDLL